MPPAIYRIRVKGHLLPEWSQWFDCMALRLEANGDTTLVGPVVDQPALHALLARVRDLGLTLLAVSVVRSDEPEMEEL